MCPFFTIDKYYYVFLKCVNKDIIIRLIKFILDIEKTMCEPKKEFNKKWVIILDSL